MNLILKLSGTIALLAIMALAVMPAYADTDKPSIQVSDVTIAPSALMPGDTGTITIIIANPPLSLSGSTTTQNR